MLPYSHSHSHRCATPWLALGGPRRLGDLGKVTFLPCASIASPVKGSSPLPPHQRLRSCSPKSQKTGRGLLLGTLTTLPRAEAGRAARRGRRDRSCVSSSPKGFGRGCSEGHRSLEGGSCVHIEIALEFSSGGGFPGSPPQDQLPLHVGPAPSPPGGPCSIAPSPPSMESTLPGTPLLPQPPATSLTLPLPSCLEKGCLYTCGPHPPALPKATCHHHGHSCLDL